MRFGKRLAEVTRDRGTSEPYVSYKELKHTVSKLSGLIGGSGSGCGAAEEDGDEGASSLDEAAAAAWGVARPHASALAAAAAQAPPRAPRLEAHQREFFRRLDADVAQAKAFVQGAVSALEVQVGDWQASAIVAGILFTPDQLEEISAQLPFQVDDQQVLIDWLLGLQPADQTSAAKCGLLEKYSEFASGLNALLQYIEVNLTAVRKIFKKFEKKIPAEMRIRSVRDYRAHHDLYMPAMQDLLATAVHIQRLVFGLVVPGGDGARAPGGGAAGPKAAPAVAISQIGSESLALLSWLRGPAELDDVLGGDGGCGPAGGGCPLPIDVYAKPAVDLCGGGGGSGGGSAAASPSRPGSGAAASAAASTSTGEAAVGRGYPAPPPEGGSAASVGPFETAAGLQALPVPHVAVKAPGPEALASAAAAAAMAAGSKARGPPAKVPCAGAGAAAGVEARHDPHGHEQEGGPRSGRRRGGRGNRGAGRGGRGAGGAPPGQGGAAVAGGRTPSQEATAGEGPAAAAAYAGGAGRGQGGVGGPWPSGCAMPQHLFTPFPAHVGKADGCRQAPGFAAGHAAWCGGRGGLVGKGTAAAMNPTYANTAAGGQGVVPALDPRWFAAVMPVFWPCPTGMLSVEGVSQHTSDG
uniref:SPX domain-containing protein n=1 Tax=Alexandrium monilatum TaxID=311494 RepID=A0A7S4VD55_9DINO